jgi:bacitracin transport system permease protein
VVKLVNLVYCEILKLKRCKIFKLSLLSALVAPLMISGEIIKSKLDNPEKIVTFAQLFESTNLYIMMLFGLVLYGVIAAYLISREYSENTLKSIITVPIPKISFIFSKFITLFIWIILLTIISWIATIVFGFICGAESLKSQDIFTSIKAYLLGGVFLFLTSTPIFFITMYSKNIIAPIIFMISVVMANIMLSNSDLGVYFPWTTSYLLVSGVIDKYNTSHLTSYLIIAVTFIFGTIASLIYFEKDDIK